MNIMAGFQGMRYSELLGQILQAAVERLGIVAKPAAQQARQRQRPRRGGGVEWVIPALAHQPSGHPALGPRDILVSREIPGCTALLARLALVGPGGDAAGEGDGLEAGLAHQERGGARCAGRCGSRRCTRAWGRGRASARGSPRAARAARPSAATAPTPPRSGSRSSTASPKSALRRASSAPISCSSWLLDQRVEVLLARA